MHVYFLHIVVLTLCVSFALCGVERSVFAETSASACSADADCGQDAFCDVYEVESCEVLTDSSVRCEGVLMGECVALAAHCASDGDCAQGFVCESFVTQSCDAVCPKGDESCVDAMVLLHGGACEDVSENFCVADVVPCGSDNDCLTGWSCMSSEEGQGGEESDGSGFACVPDPSLPSGRADADPTIAKPEDEYGNAYEDPYAYGGHGALCDLSQIEEEEEEGSFGCAVRGFSKGPVPWATWGLLVGVLLVVRRRRV